MGVLVLLVWLLSLALIGLTILPMVKSPRWWIRVWDYPRLQLAVALAAAAVAQLILLDRGTWSIALLLGTLVCLAVHAWEIRPYTRLHSRQVREAEHADPPNSIRLMIANVLQDNREADAFLARVEECDPDILLAVETNGWWDERIAVLEERYPHAVRHPLENTYGMHLFSRLELIGPELHERLTPDIPSITTKVRLRSGRLITLHCVHPEPPRPSIDVEERDAELLLVAREVTEVPGPMIVCGDLNDVAWSHSTRLFQRISKLLDPRVGRGLYPTFHAQYPLARWPLDHIFHDASFRLIRFSVLGEFGSDHFPVCIELLHDPAGAGAQEVPESDASDEAEATEKIEEGRAAAAQA